MSQHKCKATILHCIDFRFQEAIDKFVANKKLNGNIDRISIAGGVKNLQEILAQISLSKELHQIQEIYLVNHQDCGAYGPSISADKDLEITTHQKDLSMAKNLILKKYPTIEVHAYFLNLNKEFIEIE